MKNIYRVFSPAEMKPAQSPIPTTPSDQSGCFHTSKPPPSAAVYRLVGRRSTELPPARRKPHRTGIVVLSPAALSNTDCASGFNQQIDGIADTWNRCFPTNRFLCTLTGMNIRTVRLIAFILLVAGGAALIYGIVTLAEFRSSVAGRITDTARDTINSVLGKREAGFADVEKRAIGFIVGGGVGVLLGGGMLIFKKR